MGMFHYAKNNHQVDGLLPDILVADSSLYDKIQPHREVEFQNGNRFGPGSNSNLYNIGYSIGTAAQFETAREFIVQPPQRGIKAYYTKFRIESLNILYTYMSNIWNYNKGDYTSVQIEGGTRVLHNKLLDPNIEEQLIEKQIVKTVDGNKCHIYDWNYSLNSGKTPLHFGYPPQKTVTERWRNWNGGNGLISKPQRDVIYTSKDLENKTITKKPMYVYTFNFMPVLESLKDNSNIRNGQIKTSDFGMGTPLVTYGFLYDAEYNYCIYFAWCHTNAPSSHAMAFSYIDMYKYELVHLSDDYGVPYDGSLMRPMFAKRGSIYNNWKGNLGGAAIDKSTIANSHMSIGKHGYPIDPDEDGSLFTAYNPEKYEPGLIGLPSQGYSGRQFVEQIWLPHQKPDVYRHSFHASSYKVKMPSWYVEKLGDSKFHWVMGDPPPIRKDDGNQQDSSDSIGDNGGTGGTGGNGSGNGTSGDGGPPIDDNLGGSLGKGLDPNVNGGGSTNNNTNTNTTNTTNTPGVDIITNKDGNEFVVDNTSYDVIVDDNIPHQSYNDGVYEPTNFTPTALTDVHVFNRLNGWDVRTETRTINTYGLWYNETGSLYNHITSSVQSEASKKYFYDVVNYDSDGNEIKMYAISWGHRQGAPSNTDTETYRTISYGMYHKYRLMCLGDSYDAFYQDYSNTNDDRYDHAYFIHLYKDKMRDTLDPGNWELALSIISQSGYSFSVESDPTILNDRNTILGHGNVTTLIDDSGDKDHYFLSSSREVNGNVYYNIYSGSIEDGIYTGDFTLGGSTKAVGQVFPNLGLIVLNGTRIDSLCYLGTPSVGVFEDHYNPLRLYTSISGAAAPVSGIRTSTHPFKARSVEYETTKYIDIHVNHNRFNYSNNPTFFDEANEGTINYKSMYSDPTVYVTGIGLYDNSGDLLAVGKFNSPIKKTFEKQLNMTVKLKYTNQNG